MKINQKYIIERFKKVHGDSYNYSEVAYKGSHTYIDIICPNHGIFKQTPNVHFKGGKCPKCRADKNKRERLEQCLIDFNKKHNYKYDYSNSIYIDAHTKIEIKCPIHGIFKQAPGAHKKQQCPKCATDKNIRPFNEIKHKSNLIHNYKYDYSDSIYVNGHTNIKIKCPIHGFFNQWPKFHKIGYGCPSCANYSFKPDKPAVLYYFKVRNHPYYKIGITNHESVLIRFSAHKHQIERYHEWKFLFGRDAYRIEQEILKEFADKRYKGPKILKSGNTEMFIEDVLQLDYKAHCTTS